MLKEAYYDAILYSYVFVSFSYVLYLSYNTT